MVVMKALRTPPLLLLPPPLDLGRRAFPAQRMARVACAGASQPPASQQREGARERV